MVMTKSRLALRLAFGLCLIPACTFDDDDGAGTPSDDLGESRDGLTVCAKGSTVKGLDVSHWQGSIDFAKVKADGYRFVFMKATEGTSYVDDTFEKNWAAAKKAGLIRGAYHFFRPKYDGVAQAKHFASVMGTLTDSDLPPVLDLEVQDGVSDATVIARAKAFLAELEKRSGKKPVIYTGYFFTSLGSPSGFSGYPLWVAHWGVSCPNLPAGGWKTWKFWQFTDHANVSGIGGAVDANRFNGTLEDLIAFAKGPDHEVSGELESVSCDAAKGWAFDADTPAKALTVSVYADGNHDTGTLVGKMTADDKRSDLCAQLGSCNHGYSFAVPKSLHDGNAHALRAYATGDAGGPVLLSGSPKSVTCDPPPPPPSSAGGTGGVAGSAGASGAPSGGAGGAAGLAGVETGGSAGVSGSSGASGAATAPPLSPQGTAAEDSASCSSSRSRDRSAGLALLASATALALSRRRRRSARAT